MTVEARLSFGAENASPVGRERIRLLESVGREGSISAAARATGITYKAAWDAIDAMNNLFGRPLIAAQTGGRRGGGATLTEEGLRLVQTFHRLEAELARALRVAGKVEPVFVEDIGDLPQTLLDTVRDGDVVLGMGAGSIGQLPSKFAQDIQK